MIKRISKNLSFDAREIEQLDEIAKDTGMTGSEVVRQLINKAYIDKKCRQIITENSYTEMAKRRMRGRTSHNVQTVNEEKDAGSQEPTSTVSSNSRLNDSINSYQNTIWQRNAEKAAKDISMIWDPAFIRLLLDIDWSKYTVRELYEIGIKRSNRQ